MLGSVRSETYCFAKLQYFHCFTKFSDVFLLLVRKIMSGEVWKHHNPAACLLPHSCQDSVSRSPERGVHDTILTLKNRREIRSVFLPAISRRFFVVFPFVVYIVDIQVHTTTQLSIRNKNGGKTWLAALQNSLSCSLTLTILACKKVKVRGQNSQSQSLTLTILQRKTVWLGTGKAQNASPWGVFKRKKAYFLTAEHG